MKPFLEISPPTRFAPDQSFSSTLPVQCSVSIVSSSAGFDLLEDEWNALITQSDSTIFQTYEWLHTWWKYYNRPSDQLHILRFTCDEKLVGIAPLFIEHRRTLGARIYSRLRFIGAGLSDYLEFILRPGYEGTVFLAFAEHLQSHIQEWDIFDIEDVSKRSPLTQVLPLVLKKHSFALYWYQGTVCPSIVLPTIEEVSVKALGPMQSSNFKRKFKKLEQGFGAAVTLYRDQADDIEKGIEEFSSVHAGRWKSQGYPSAFDEPKQRAFHIDFSRKFAQRGWLRLYILKANEEPVAAIYDFNYGERIYMYQCNAYGTDAIMKQSPGYIVRSIAIEEGIKEGMRVFDFLRGDESYKYKEWSAIDTPNYLIRVAAPDRLSRLRFFLFLMVEFWSKCRKRIVREYYGFRRYTIEQRRSRLDKLNFIGSRIGELFLLAYNFIIRHFPLGLVRKLQIIAKQTAGQPLEHPKD